MVTQRGDTTWLHKGEAQGEVEQISLRRERWLHKVVTQRGDTRWLHKGEAQGEVELISLRRQSARRQESTSPSYYCRPRRATIVDLAEVLLSTSPSYRVKVIQEGSRKLPGQSVPADWPRPLAH